MSIRLRAVVCLTALLALTAQAGREVLRTVAELQAFTHSAPSGVRDFRLTATVLAADESPHGQIVVCDKTEKTLTILQPPPADSFGAPPLETTYYLTPRDVCSTPADSRSPSIARPAPTS